MGWDNDEQMNQAEKEMSGGGQFVRLEDDGDSCRFVVLSGVTTLVYRPKFGIEEPKTKDDLRLMFRLPVAEEETDGKWTVKVLEASGKRLTNLGELNAKGLLKSWLVEWKRKGRAGDSKTDYTTAPHRPLTPQEQAWIEDLKRSGQIPDLLAGTYTLDCKKIERGEGGGSNGAAAHASSNGNGPHDVSAGAISQSAANEISGLLKPLMDTPRASEIGKFLKKFDVRKVVELPASREAEALTEARRIAGVQAPAEDNPFA